MVVDVHFIKMVVDVLSRLTTDAIKYEVDLIINNLHDSHHPGYMYFAIAIIAQIIVYGLTNK